MNTPQRPKIGARFAHSRQIEPDGTPTIMQITRNSGPVTYYRAVNQDDSLSGRWWINIADLDSIVKEWLS